LPDINFLGSGSGEFGKGKKRMRRKKKRSGKGLEHFLRGSRCLLPPSREYLCGQAAVPVTS